MARRSARRLPSWSSALGRLPKNVVLGRISAPFGVRGWVKIQLFTQNPEHLLERSNWSLGRDDKWREFEVVQAQPHGNSLIAELAGVESREAAAQLKGMQVAVERASLPPAEENEFYWADLIGLAVRNRQGESYGEIADMLATGANDVMVVRGERERLIPFVGHVVDSIDLDARSVIVDWPADF